jgi:hypothetical protein
LGVTLAELRALRAAWYAAELAVATGQSYTIGDRTLTRADAAFITKQLAKYDAQLSAIEAGRGAGVRLMRGVPRDL